MKKRIFLQIMENEKKRTEANRILDEVLKSEPDFMLSSDFAEKVAMKVSRQFAWNQYFKEFLVYLAAIFGVVSVPVIIEFLWDKSGNENWTNFILPNISWIAGVNILIIFILFADRVLLRYFFYKASIKTD